MPVMDGCTATRILRQHDVQVPIVGVTGNTLQEDLQSFTQAGANEILVRRQRAVRISEKRLRRVRADTLLSAVLSLSSLCLLLQTKPVNLGQIRRVLQVYASR